MTNCSKSRALLRIIAIAAIFVGAVPSVALADGGEAEDTKSSGTKDAYPVQLSLRPLTLFQGMTQASLSVGYLWIDDTPNTAPVSHRTRFGITDWWEASARTSMLLRPDVEWRDVVNLSTKILVYDSERFDFAPGIQVPINFDKADDAHLFPGVALDATTRVFPTNRFSVICGEGLLPLGVGRRASLNLNCSVVGQGNPSFGFRISGQLLHIRLNGDVRESTFLNTLPAVTYFHSIGNWVDLSATYRFYGDAFGLWGGISIRK